MVRIKKPNKKLLEKKLDTEWSAYVRGRDSKCQKCGGQGSVSAHHAFGRRHHATRWDVNNGVGLCYPCHIHWAHRDPCSFAEWFKSHVGSEKYNALSGIHNKVVKYDADCLQTMLDWFYKENV